MWRDLMQYDAVIDTFSLCVINDPLSAIREMKRVVKPSGDITMRQYRRYLGHNINRGDNDWMTTKLAIELV